MARLDERITIWHDRVLSQANADEINYRLFLSWNDGELATPYIEARDPRTNVLIDRYEFTNADALKDALRQGTHIDLVADPVLGTLTINNTMTITAKTPSAITVSATADGYEIGTDDEAIMSAVAGNFVGIGAIETSINSTTSNVEIKNNNEDTRDLILIDPSEYTLVPAGEPNYQTKDASETATTTISNATSWGVGTLYPRASLSVTTDTAGQYPRTGVHYNIATGEASADSIQWVTLNLQLNLNGTISTHTITALTPAVQGLVAPSGGFEVSQYETVIQASPSVLGDKELYATYNRVAMVNNTIPFTDDEGVTRSGFEITLSLFSQADYVATLSNGEDVFYNHDVESTTGIPSFAVRLDRVLYDGIELAEGDTTNTVTINTTVQITKTYSGGVTSNLLPPKPYLSQVLYARNYPNLSSIVFNSPQDTNIPLYFQFNAGGWNTDFTGLGATRAIPAYAVDHDNVVQVDGQGYPLVITDPWISRASIGWDEYNPTTKLAILTDGMSFFSDTLESLNNFGIAITGVKIYRSVR